MKIAVVGLGYVGLPLVIRLSQLNFDVLGIDIDLEKIQKLQKGLLPFAQDEPNLKNYFEKENKKSKMAFSSTFEKIVEKDLVFISVDTPIIGKVPEFSSLVSALISISPNIKRRPIIVIESTVSPNTSKDLIIPTLEKHSRLKVNKGFFVAVAPERIRPNHIFEQLTTLSRVIGMSDRKTEPFLKKVYSQITSGEIDFTDLTTAETVKTVENSLRDINIAFANEIAMACEEIGVNVWEVRELVNKSPFHNMLMPGAGVGGHCIPKDPWLLASSVKKQKMKLIKTSRNINDQMPAHILKIVKSALRSSGKDINDSRLAILGFSFVENSDDARNSPTKSLIKILEKEKIRFKVHDPLINSSLTQSLDNVLKGADCLILMVAHNFYNKLDLKKTSALMAKKIIVDGRNFFDKNKVKSYGFKYYGIGNVISS